MTATETLSAPAYTHSVPTAVMPLPHPHCAHCVERNEPMCAQMGLAPGFGDGPAPQADNMSGSSARRRWWPRWCREVVAWSTDMVAPASARPGHARSGDPCTDRPCDRPPAPAAAAELSGGGTRSAWRPGHRPLRCCHGMVSRPTSVAVGLRHTETVGCDGSGGGASPVVIASDGCLLGQVLGRGVNERSPVIGVRVRR